MGAAVIIERIAGALQRAELPPVVEALAFVPLTTIGDLLRPWDEVFPGVQRPDPDGEDAGDFRRNRRIMSVLRRPKFIPQPRRSVRALPAPHPLASAPKLVHPDLFQAVAAVWEWYQLKGDAKPELLTQPFDFNGIHKFVDPLWNALSDYYPLGVDLENIGSDGPVSDMPGLCLRLPMWSFDDPGSGVVEAFLSGASGIEWLMAHCLQTFQWDLPKQDLQLIGSIGWGKLAQSYAAAPGKKTYNLSELENFEDTFFKEVKAVFPEQYGEGVNIIDDGWGTEVWIRCKEDIEYGLAFSEAFYRLSDALPDPDSFENCSDTSALFAHELCNVWRRVNGKRQVKWAPKEVVRV